MRNLVILVLFVSTSLVGCDLLGSSSDSKSEESVVNLSEVNGAAGFDFGPLALLYFHDAESIVSDSAEIKSVLEFANFVLGTDTPVSEADEHTYIINFGKNNPAFTENYYRWIEREYGIEDSKRAFLPLHQDTWQIRGDSIFMDTESELYDMLVTSYQERTVSKLVIPFDIGYVGRIIGDPEAVKAITDYLRERMELRDSDPKYD